MKVESTWSSCFLLVLTNATSFLLLVVLFSCSSRRLTLPFKMLSIALDLIPVYGVKG